MSRDSEVRELSRNRAYRLKTGDTEFTAIKLEGFKAIQLGGTVSPISVSAEGKKVEGDDWLIVVKDKNNIVVPYETWVREATTKIGNVSGSHVSTVSVVSGNVETLYDTMKVEGMDGLSRAFVDGWREPYQYASNKYVLRRPKPKHGDISVIL